MCLQVMAVLTAGGRRGETSSTPLSLHTRSHGRHTVLQQAADPLDSGDMMEESEGWKQSGSAILCRMAGRGQSSAFPLPHPVSPLPAMSSTAVVWLGVREQLVSDAARGSPVQLSAGRLAIAGSQSPHSPHPPHPLPLLLLHIEHSS